ncbi:type II toxin-antitoxin system death-on-curing family toxin [Streptococcus sobrinus]|uniref:type II toxin-antitoxin system death-on-curing family toxin n=1 Tax=Streptococcus sobrinus TaxID=1310 RepID=UPI003F64DF9A
MDDKLSNRKSITAFNKGIIEHYSPSEKVEVVSASALNMIVNFSEQFVFGQKLYPTLFDKATIIFVQLVKKHVFANANKRTAFFVLVSFLRLNGYQLQVDQEEAVDFTVRVAVEPLSDDNLIIYKDWISNHSTKL